MKSIFAPVRDETPEFKDRFAREYDIRVQAAGLAFDDHEAREKLAEQIAKEMRT